MAIIKNISAVNRIITDLKGVAHTITPGSSISLNNKIAPLSTYTSFLASGYIEVSDTVDVPSIDTATLVDASEQVVQGVAKALPATTTGNIFAVVGGPVEILELFGEVTTVVQTQTCNFKYKVTDTASSTTTDISANADISAAAVGSFLTLNTTLGGATLITAGGTGIKNNATVRCPIGTIKVTTGATNTGAVRYQVRYRPLAPGAKVTAL